MSPRYLHCFAITVFQFVQQCGRPNPATEQVGTARRLNLVGTELKIYRRVLTFSTKLEFVHFTLIVVYKSECGEEMLCLCFSN